MGLLIRTLLIWLLVLAVPAQGVAAATMAFCGPQHHGSRPFAQAQTAAPDRDAQPCGHAAGAVQNHDHDLSHEQPQAQAQAQSAAAAEADPSFASDSDANGEGQQAKQHKCSACATCCSVNALLTSVLAVPSPVFTPTVFSTVVPSVDAFAADGPERPPRPVLA